MSSQMIADRIALQDVMLNYAAGVDDRNHDLYQSCFTDDVEVLDFGPETYNGKAEWLEYVWSALEKYSASQHMLGRGEQSGAQGTRAGSVDVPTEPKWASQTRAKYVLWGSGSLILQ